MEAQLAIECIFDDISLLSDLWPHSPFEGLFIKGQGGAIIETEQVAASDA